jgi:hypothetical protein
VREHVTVVTAAGVLETTVRDTTSVAVSRLPREERAQTSSSTGGPTWVKPAGRDATQTQEAIQARKPQGVITVVTAEGLLKTVAVNTVAGGSTVGYSWTRPATGIENRPWAGESLGTVQEVTPRAITTPAALEIGAGVRGIAIDDATTTADRVAPVCETVPTVGAANGPETPATRGPMSAQSRQELSAFISTAVLPKTNRVYEKEWVAFKAFVKTETGSDDPFLTNYTDDEKASLVALMMMRRHEAGKRGKAATAFTAAVRQMYARMMRATAFFDSSIIATARMSCLMKPDELRALKDSGPVATVKLPICEGILTDLRARSWPEGWSDEAKRLKAVYVGTMYGFETAGRIGEFTHCELGNQDHCARVDDFTFAVETLGATRNVLGSGLAALRLTDSVEGRQSLVECRVRTVSSKGKVVVKPKLIARRSPEEAEFLDDLAAWITYSGTAGTDEVFSFRRRDGNLVHLTGRSVRDEIKKTCASNGLPPDYFSAHSLRKGAITHMRAQGASEDDRRDRGNYAAGSTVMNSVYDYATGLGPLASNSLEGGHRLDKKDLKRMLPPARKSV